jgi:hypothetical protein
MEPFPGAGANAAKTARAASSGAVFRLACLVLAAALMFGGAARQGIASDAIPELAALALFAVALPALEPNAGALALVLGVVVLPCVQLIPLPPSVWSGLPGRGIVVDVIAVIGAPPSWRPISLVPSATCRALLSLLPAIAMFVAVLGLDRRARGQLLFLVVAIGAASVVLALLQVVGGQQSALYFFDVVNVGKGVGFFANANHFGALQVALPPLAAVTLADLRPRSSPLAIALIGGVAPALLFGLSLSGSRSAIVLGGLSLAATLPLLLAPELGRPRRSAFVVFATVLAIVLPSLMAELGMLQIPERFSGADIAGDARWTIAASAFAGAASVFPFGAGVGTFPAAYPSYERVVDLLPQFVNRAHDDALETLFEGGAASVALGLGFIVWLSRATLRALKGAPTADRRQARAGALVMWLLLLHSLWDYPLRTIALETLFGLCAALQFAPPPSSPDDPPFRWPCWRRRGRRRRIPTVSRPVPSTIVRDEM